MIRKEDFSPEMIGEFGNNGIYFVSDKAELEKVCGRDPNLVALKGFGYAIEQFLSDWRGEKGLPWTEMRGVRILDIGSGSDHRKARWKESPPPWFARICAVLGAEVTALDRFPQGYYDEKIFTGLAVELVPVVYDGGGISQIPELKGGKFDFIHSSNLVGWNYDPSLLSGLTGQQKSAYSPSGFERRLFGQCAQMLEAGGILDLDEIDFKGRNRVYKSLGDHLFELPPR